MKCLDLSGLWQCEIPGRQATVRLPGTLDENGVGFPDDPAHQWMRENAEKTGFWQPGDPIVTRLTRRFTYTGEARFTRRISWQPQDGKRAFVEVERARQLRLLVNGREARPLRPANLIAPYCFEVTGLVTGEDELTFLSDNSYPGWPREAIVYSSAASDETQTNWNGLLGYIRLRQEAPAFISGVRVYPRGDVLDVCVAVNADRPGQRTVRIVSDALAESAALAADLPEGEGELWLRGLPLRTDARRWELGEGVLHALTVSADGMEDQTVSFGIRDFAARDGHLTLNGRRFFLRGEANCAVFPETGYPPMDVDRWKTILQTYRRYGVNCVRFHSHCPPEAAFTAADQLGMLMQPELSHWDPAHAFATGEARRYYRDELLEALRFLADHPSFVMLTFGNELQADAAGHAFMDQLLREARAYDPTRLYANGSNVHYGEIGADPQSDFYTAMMYLDHDMRATCDGPKGWLNREYPNTRRNYDGTMDALRQKTDQPVFSFEVGQYEVLPDFDQINGYHGVTSPENLRHIRKKMREKGLEKDWRRRVEATGESSLLCYRAEVEAALRTAGYSGISLLGLQDFPGQGTALMGMMNAHLQPKPYAFARPERFAAFFRDALPLALLPRFTFTAGERVAVPLKMANYGKDDLAGIPVWSLEGPGFSARGALPQAVSKAGGLTDLGEMDLDLRGIGEAARLTLRVEFAGQQNAYDLWVYPGEKPVCPDTVYECRTMDEHAEAALRAGGVVYLSPESTAEALPHSIQAQFSPDFWSVCTFPKQSGAMGQLIDAGHPLFRHFPTEEHTTWQWWPMANRRAMVLPGPIDAIIAEIDSCSLLRPMAQLLECRCGGGRLLVSSLGLQDLQQYPEGRALQSAVYRYLASDDFQPVQTLPVSWIRGAL